MGDIKNVRSFLFEFKDGTELRLVEKENYDKLVERIKELEAKLEEANKQLDLDYVDKNYIPKQKVKDKIEEIKLSGGNNGKDNVENLARELATEVLEELLEEK